MSTPRADFGDDEPSFNAPSPGPLGSGDSHTNAAHEAKLTEPNILGGSTADPSPIPATGPTAPQGGATADEVPVKPKDRAPRKRRDRPSEEASASAKAPPALKRTRKPKGSTTRVSATPNASAFWKFKLTF